MSKSSLTNMEVTEMYVKALCDNFFNDIESGKVPINTGAKTIITFYKTYLEEKDVLEITSLISKSIFKIIHIETDENGWDCVVSIDKKSMNQMRKVNESIK